MGPEKAEKIKAQLYKLWLQEQLKNGPLNEGFLKRMIRNWTTRASTRVGWPSTGGALATTMTATWISRGSDERTTRGVRLSVAHCVWVRAKIAWTQHIGPG